MDLSSILSGITEKANNAGPIGKTLKFDFGGEHIYIDGTGEGNVVSSEDKDADCLIIVNKETFMELIKGDLNPMMAVMSGKIKIKGDMSVAMAMQSLI